MRAVLVIMCTASAATSAGPTTRRMGSGAKLVATFFELIAQQFRGQRCVHESRGDEVDSHGCDLKRQVSGEGGERSGTCSSDAHAHRRASSTSGP